MVTVEAREREAECESPRESERDSRLRLDLGEGRLAVPDETSGERGTRRRRRRHNSSCGGGCDADFFRGVRLSKDHPGGAGPAEHIWQLRSDPLAKKER